MIKTFEFPKYYKVQVNEETGEVKIYSNSKHAKGRELSQFLNPNGYLIVKLNNKSVQIHQLVALFYLGERNENLVVNHKDGNKLNNKIENLEYVTIAENIKHAVKNGLHVSSNPEKHGNYKDGRCKDSKKYKNEWYLKNRKRILKKASERYQKTKALQSVSV
jgi:hypothetical protein